MISEKLRQHKWWRQNTITMRTPKSLRELWLVHLIAESHALLIKSSEMELLLALYNWIKSLPIVVSSCLVPRIIWHHVGLNSSNVAPIHLFGISSRQLLWIYSHLPYEYPTGQWNMEYLHFLEWMPNSEMRHSMMSSMTSSMTHVSRPIRETNFVYLIYFSASHFHFKSLIIQAEIE